MLNTSGTTGVLRREGYQKSKVLMTADGPMEILQQVKAESGVVLNISPVSSLGLYLVKPKSLQVGARILQAIAFSVDGGLTPGRALTKVLEDLPPNLGLKTKSALEILRSGGGFTDAIKSLKVFDSTSVAMLESGEQSGGVKESIRSTIAHIQSANKSFKALMAAVSWTFIDIIFAVSAIVGLRYQFLPKLAEQSKDIKGEDQKLEFLNAIDISLNICDILTFLSLVLLVVGFLLLLGFQSSVPKIRNFCANLIGNIPGLGKAIYNASMAASTGVSSRMMQGGVAFISTLDIASRSAQLPVVSKVWLKVKLRLESGDSVTEALQSKHFLPTEQLLISTHTSQEQLSFVFDTISKAREDMSLASSKAFAVFGFVSSLIYTGFSVILVLWVVYVQNKYLLQGINY